MKRITSTLLVLCMLISMIMSNTPALREAAYAQITTEGSTQEQSAENTVLSADELTSYITYDMAQAEGHIQRLYNEESLDTLVFGNSDGTKTTYFFAENIKYTN